MRNVTEILQSMRDVFDPDDDSHLVEMTSLTCEGDTPLHVLLWRKDTESAEVLIDAGAAVDAPGDMNETPLHVAVRQDLPEVVELLLAKGADPNVRCDFGDTPHERATKLKGQCAKLFQRGAA